MYHSSIRYLYCKGAKNIRGQRMVDWTDVSRFWSVGYIFNVVNIFKKCHIFNVGLSHIYNVGHTVNSRYNVFLGQQKKIVI